MRNLATLTAASVIALAISAQSAAAQAITSGTITETGTIDARCTVIAGGAGSTFTGNVPLGELADVTGQLKSALSGSNAASPAVSLPYHVNCNTAAPKITVSNNTTLLNSSASAPSGYTNSVYYTANVAAALVTPATQNTTLVVNAAGQTANSTLAARLANQANNIVVTLYAFAPSTPGAVLVSGNYASTLTITISPT